MVPATVRARERAGILVPAREGGSRRYSSDDVRGAALAHLLRRGGYPLAHIAVVVDARLEVRARAMLTAADRLGDYLQAREGEPDRA